MTTYTALGLSDTGNVELAAHHTQGQCREWVRGYTKGGDFGGYYGIAIISPDGEWLETYDAPEVDEWSGAPCPDDPDNFWICDRTGDRIPA